MRVRAAKRRLSHDEATSLRPLATPQPSCSACEYPPDLYGSGPGERNKSRRRRRSRAGTGGPGHADPAGAGSSPGRQLRRRRGTSSSAGRGRSRLGAARLPPAGSGRRGPLPRDPDETAADGGRRAHGHVRPGGPAGVPPRRRARLPLQERERRRDHAGDPNGGRRRAARPNTVASDDRARPGRPRIDRGRRVVLRVRRRSAGRRSTLARLRGSPCCCASRPR